MAEALGSDFSFDFQCSPCTDEGLNNEATKLCTKCKLYLCGSCIKGHDRIFKDHTTLNKAEFQQSQHGDQQLIEICTKHGGKVIDMYCEDDDIVGCAVCISLNHRTCETIQYIPEMTIDQRNAEKLDETMKQVSASCQKYLCMKDELRQKLEINTKETIEMLELVERKRLEINAVLDEFQEKLLSQVHDRNDNVKEILRCATMQCDNVLKPLRVLENNIHKAKSMDQTRSFIALKVAKQTLSERNVTDENIQAFKIPEPILVKDMMQAVTRAIGRTSLLLLRGPVTDVCELRCWGPSLENPSGMLCSLPNGHVICTDSEKEKVYQFDAYNNLLHSIDVSGEPSGLCKITEDEVAVTISDERNVQFLKINDGFEMARSFTVDWACNGILKLNDKLYIIHPCEENVGIYNLDGKLLSIIDRDESGNKLITDPEYISCSSDQSKVYIWSSTGTITVFDSHGKHLRSINCQEDMLSDDESSASIRAESLSGESTEHIPQTTEYGNTKENDTAEGDGNTVEIMSCQGSAKGLWFEIMCYHNQLAR